MKEVEAVLDHFVCTRNGSYWKFLVKWKRRPSLEYIWIVESDPQGLNPNLYKQYLVYHSTMPSSIKLGTDYRNQFKMCNRDQNRQIYRPNL